MVHVEGRGPGRRRHQGGCLLLAPGRGSWVRKERERRPTGDVGPVRDRRRRPYVKLEKLRVLLAAFVHDTEAAVTGIERMRDRGPRSTRARDAREGVP